MSITVTVKEQVPELPNASVTRKVLVVTPTGKDAPDVSPPIKAVDAPGQLSVPTGTM